MAIQDEFGRVGFFEDFLGNEAAVTLTDATAGARWNDILLTGISGDVAMTFTVDEPGGVAAFSGAAGAGDGVGLVGGRFVPSTMGTIAAGGRFKVSAATDYRAFLGWAETVALAEPVNPFTLSGTTLTSNDAGQAVGFYYDTGATTDDFRLHASSDGTELTTAAVKPSIDGSTTLGALGIRCSMTLTADRWMIWRVEIDPDGTVRGYFGDETMGNTLGLSHIATIAAGNIDETANYHPVMYLLEESTGDPTHEVDYFWGKGHRDWADD